MCSCHFTLHKDLLISSLKYSRVPIEASNGETIFSVGKGDVRVFWKKSKLSDQINPIIKRDILYVSKSSISPISLDMIAEKGVI